MLTAAREEPLSKLGGTGPEGVGTPGAGPVGTPVGTPGAGPVGTEGTTGMLLLGTTGTGG